MSRPSRILFLGCGSVTQAVLPLLLRDVKVPASNITILDFVDNRHRIANELQLHFVELSRDIEKLAGCKTHEIHSLYGPLAYQRYQLRALESALASELPAIIATTGGIVMDLQAWEKLQAQCLTIWLQAKPEDHLNRVMAQGDMRPMAGSSQALEDLKHILDERTPMYSQAHQSFDTSAFNLKEAVKRLSLDLKYAMKLA